MALSYEQRVNVEKGWAHTLPRDSACIGKEKTEGLRVQEHYTAIMLMVRGAFGQKVT